MTKRYKSDTVTRKCPPFCGCDACIDREMAEADKIIEDSEKLVKTFPGVKIEKSTHCIMCGKTLDPDTDHENSCTKCE